MNADHTHFRGEMCGSPRLQMRVYINAHTCVFVRSNALLGHGIQQLKVNCVSVEYNKKLPKRSVRFLSIGQWKPKTKYQLCIRSIQRATSKKYVCFLSIGRRKQKLNINCVFVQYNEQLPRNLCVSFHVQIYL